ncbi:MAG: hypothetical protein ACLGSH_11120 [Acidobacteriota bacterium]
MNKSTYGENLFEAYLVSHGIAFEKEPRLPGVNQLIDFVIDHPTHGKVLLELKDIVNPPPTGSFSMIDPYKPIREHIEEGTRKFRSTADYVCGLVLAAPPGSFVQLNEPYVMLGSMYGDMGFRVPLGIRPGAPANDDVRSEFLVGKGKMVRPSRLQNTRIAALISIQEFSIWHLAMRKYINTDDGRTRAERGRDVFEGTAGLPDDMEAKESGITVWENAAASKKLPSDLFNGQMDAWYEFSYGYQTLTFVGERRRSLGVDDRT